MRRWIAAGIAALVPIIAWSQTQYPMLPALVGNEMILLSYVNPPSLGPIYTSPNQLSTFIGGGGGSPGGSTNSVQFKSGASTFGGVSLTDGQLAVGQTGAAPLAKSMSGDGSLSAGGALTLTNSASTRTNLGLGTAASPTFTGLTLSGITGTQCLHSTSGVVTGSGADCSGSITVTDGTHSVTGATTVTYGNGFLVSGTTPNATVSTTTSDVTKSSNYTAAAGDMGGALSLEGSGATLTLPAASSTIFASGMSLTISTAKATGNWTLTNSTGLTLNGLNSTTLPPGVSGTFVANANGTSLDFYPGMQPPTSTVLGGVIAGNGISISSAGVASVAAATLAAGTSVSLTAPRQYYVCTGTCTVTPPVPAAGYEFCVMNDDNVTTVITLAALGSSARYESTARTSYGTAGTGTLVSGGAAADKVCIVGRDSTHYLTVSFNGTWTAN